jgi:hypothetical protein
MAPSAGVRFVDGATVIVSPEPSLHRYRYSGKRKTAILSAPASNDPIAIVLEARESTADPAGLRR